MSGLFATGLPVMSYPAILRNVKYDRQLIAAFVRKEN